MFCVQHNTVAFTWDRASCVSPWPWLPSLQSLSTRTGHPGAKSSCGNWSAANSDCVVSTSLGKVSFHYSGAQTKRLIFMEHQSDHITLPLKYLSDIVTPRPYWRPKPSGIRKLVSGPSLPFHVSSLILILASLALCCDPLPLCLYPLNSAFSPGKAFLPLHAQVSIPHFLRILQRPLPSETPCESQHQGAKPSPPL